MNVAEKIYGLKCFFILVLLNGFVLYSSAQKEFNVMDWKTDVTLNTYLLHQMHQQYEKRTEAFSKALTSKKEAEAYIRSVQKKYRELIGELPERTPLNPVITGTIARKGYHIEKLVYESFPDHHVTANLYIPDGAKNLPAVLLFCGHEDVSKATESYQKTAILFATNGFVVLVIDPISQGERHQLTENGKSLTRGGTTEHTLLNAGSNLFGGCTPADQLWDNVRGLDYLVTRKEVDSTRIGCLGNSGGAMQSIYFAGFEKRIQAIAVSSFLMKRQRTLELTGPSDGCSHISGEGKAGLEMNDLLMAGSPKPVLVLAGKYDFIDYEGTKAATEELKKLYSVLGQGAKVKLFTFEDGHGISKPKREEAVTWFRRWFYKDSKHVKEGELEVLDEKTLFVTAPGSVNVATLNEKNIQDRNLDLYARLSAARKNFMLQDDERVRNKIAERIGINPTNKVFSIETVGVIQKGSIVYRKLIVRKQSEPPLPLLVVFPPSAPKHIVVWLDSKGKNFVASDTLKVKSITGMETILILPDLRGQGETTDRAEANDPKYYNKEYRNALLSLHIGKTLVGQRATDILSVLNYIQQDSLFKPLPVQIRAFEETVVPALHAALFHSATTVLEESFSTISYRQLLENPATRDAYSFVIPGVLRYYDLPDLITYLNGRIVFSKRLESTVH